MSINIGITGNKGFIGKHLVGALKNKKNVRLFLFDLPEYDLLKPNSLKNFVVGKDVIVHTAAVNRGSDVEVIAGSVVATYNLISAMIKFKARAKLIYLSSVQAKTETPFGLSKRITEVMLKDFSEKHKIPVTIFRLTNVFGEGCRPFYNSVIATFCHQIVHSKDLKIINGDKKINFIYVKDVVKKIVKEIFTKRRPPFYFKEVITNNEITVSKLACLIKSFKSIKNPRKLKSKFQKDLYNTYFSYIKS